MKLMDLGTGILIAALAVGAFKAVEFFSKGKPNNPIEKVAEEVAEEVVKAETGLTVDLGEPNTPKQ